MRREGYELGVSRPEVIYKEIDGEIHEPYEQHQGAVMERMGERKGELRNMVPDGKGRIRLEYLIPTRGLIGFQTEFMTLTSGSGLKFQTFDHYGPKKRRPRQNAAQRRSRLDGNRQGARLRAL